MIPYMYELSLFNFRQKIQTHLNKKYPTNAGRKVIDDTLSEAFFAIEKVMEDMYNDVKSVMIGNIELGWRVGNIPDVFNLFCRTPFCLYEILETRAREYVLKKDSREVVGVYCNPDEAMMAALNHFRKGLGELLHVPSYLDKAFCVDNDERNKNHG